MTKQEYFEMCEMMGSDPVEEEIPVELDDLPAEVQQAVQIYGILPDIWDTMVGRYSGKKMNNIKDIFDMWEVNPIDRKIIYTFLLTLDNLRMQDLNTK